MACHMNDTQNHIQSERHTVSNFFFIVLAVLCIDALVYLLCVHCALCSSAIKLHCYELYEDLSSRRARCFEVAATTYCLPTILVTKALTIVRNEARLILFVTFASPARDATSMLSVVDLLLVVSN
jgi:hypothetical protein